MPQLLSAYLFLASLLAVSLLTPLAIRLGHRWAVLDHPGDRKIHKSPTPLTGGWALFAAYSLVLWGHLLAAFAFRDTGLVDRLGDRIHYFVNLTPRLLLQPLDIYAGALAVFLLGLADDLRGMSVRRRLLYQALVAAALVGSGLRPNLGFLPPWIAGGIGIVWIVGITNAFNFLDGLDGLSAGVALVAAAALLVVTSMTGNQPVVTFMLVMEAGLLLGFLRWNYHPAKVFLGSSGSLLVGYFLATSSLRVTYMVGHADNWLLPILVPVFILAIPIYDTTSVVLIRLIQGRSVAIGDQSHFHHRLMRAGFSHLQAVLFICLIAFAVALSAVRLVEASLWGSALILVQIVGILSIIAIAERVAGRSRRRMLDRQRRREQRGEGVDVETKGGVYDTREGYVETKELK